MRACFRFRRGEDRGAHAVGRGGDSPNAHAGGIVNRVEDCGGGGNQGLLADAFRAVRTDRGWIFDEDGFDRGHIADRGDQIIVEILALAGKEFFHQSHAQALRGAAFDLAFDESGIDGAANIVGGDDSKDAHGAEFDIDTDFGEMRAEAEDGVGIALAVFIERSGGRIECGFGGGDVAARVERKCAKIDRARARHFLRR